MDTITTYETVAEDAGVDVEAFTAYCSNFHISAEDAESEIPDFIDSYFGQFDSDREFGEFYAHVVSGIMEGVRENVWMYFDYAKYTKDLLMGDMWNDNGHYFQSLC
jgi:hypothetical protein